MESAEDRIRLRWNVLKNAWEQNLWNGGGVGVIAKLMGLKTISPTDLMKVIREGQVVCYDVNSYESWKHAHVPGALHLDPMAYSESELPADRNTPLVFYCSNLFCRKAPNAARRAIEMGFRNVRVMSAGLSGWLAGGHPTEAGAAI